MYDHYYILGMTKSLITSNLQFMALYVFKYAKKLFLSIKEVFRGLMLDMAYIQF